MTYIAQTILSHRETGALTLPGEAVDVSHLTPDELMMLESMNVIQPAPPAPVVETQPEAPADGGQED